MKNIYLGLLALFIFSGCEKIGMEDATIEIVVAEPEISAYRDSPIVYLHGWYGPRQLGETYIEKLKEELSHGKLEVVDQNADYVLVLKDLYVAEETWKDYDKVLSELQTDASFTLVDRRSDEFVDAFRHSTLNADHFNDGSFCASGGVGKSFVLHAKETRKKVKKLIRESQN